MPAWLKALIPSFLQKRESEPDNVVIFGGGVAPCAYSGPEEYEFSGYIPMGDKAVWFPAVASDEAVIAQLKSMKIGQTFRVVAESNWGTLGTRVDALEVIKGGQVYNVPADEPSSFKI